ncbi:MAG: hypothetical protein M1828_001892 [Chrysothrix sp. TS-e1954]|nr:MAG: hypothetical protein M1828_001892 [Chrysothrix sp. TS-e1954]
MDHSSNVSGQAGHLMAFQNLGGLSRLEALPLELLEMVSEYVLDGWTFVVQKHPPAKLYAISHVRNGADTSGQQGGTQAKAQNEHGLTFSMMNHVYHQTFEFDSFKAVREFLEQHPEHMMIRKIKIRDPANVNRSRAIAWNEHAHLVKTFPILRRGGEASNLKTISLNLQCRAMNNLGPINMGLPCLRVRYGLMCSMVPWYRPRGIPRFDEHDNSAVIDLGYDWNFVDEWSVVLGPLYRKAVILYRNHFVRTGVHRPPRSWYQKHSTWDEGTGCWWDEVELKEGPAPLPPPKVIKRRRQRTPLAARVAHATGQSTLRTLLPAPAVAMSKNQY